MNIAGSCQEQCSSIEGATSGCKSHPRALYGGGNSLGLACETSENTHPHLKHGGQCHELPAGDGVQFPLVPPLDQRRLKNFALSIANRMARHECPDEMAKDLMQVGHLKYLTTKHLEFLWSDIYRAMLNEVSRWKYQCDSGRRKTRELQDKVELKVRHGYKSPSPEFLLALKEQLLARPTAKTKSRKGGRTFYCTNCQAYFSKVTKARHLKTDANRKRERSTHKNFMGIPHPSTDKYSSLTGTQA